MFPDRDFSGENPVPRWTVCVGGPTGNELTPYLGPHAPRMRRLGPHAPRMRRLVNCAGMTRNEDEKSGGRKRLAHEELEPERADLHR